MDFDSDDLKDFMKTLMTPDELSDTMSILIYGLNGTGKTRLASTFPKPLLVADIREIGTASIKGVPGIKVNRIRKWEDIELLYWFFKTQNSKLKTPFKTVVLDTITQLEQLAIRYVMNKEAREFNIEIDSKSDMDMPKIRDYGNAASLLKAWLMRFRDLQEEGVYVVFNCQRKVDGSDDADEDGEHEIFPQLMKSIRSILGGAVTHIVYTEIREKSKTVKGQIINVPVYRIRTGPSPKVLTKFRVPVGQKPPAYIANPTFDKIVSVMEGKDIDEKPKKKKTKEE